MKNLFYYSFVVGTIGQKESEHKFDDLKLPASSPVAAMFLRETMHRFIYAHNRKITFTFDKDALFRVYRKVYEFELKERRGKTQMRWKLVNIHNVSETLFRNYLNK